MFESLDSKVTEVKWKWREKKGSTGREMKKVTYIPKKLWKQNPGLERKTRTLTHTHTHTLIQQYVQ